MVTDQCDTSPMWLQNSNKNENRKTRNTHTYHLNSNFPGKPGLAG